MSYPQKLQNGIHYFNNIKNRRTERIGINYITDVADVIDLKFKFRT